MTRTPRRRLLAALAAAVPIATTIGLLNPAIAHAAGAFNGTAGYFRGNTTINSAGGTGLTWNGTPAYANDNYPGTRDRTSYQLDGKTTLSDADTSVGNLGSNNFAIGAHFKSTKSAARILLLSKQADCSGQGNWLQISLANSGVYVQAVGPSSSAEFTGTYSLTAGLLDGKWHYVELIRADNTLYLYIDGLRRATAAYSGRNPSNTARLTLGGGACANSKSIQNLTGELSSVYIGPGTTYTLSSPNADPKVPAGSTGNVTLNYRNAPYGTTFTGTVTQPKGTKLASLSGPGCNVKTSSCTYPLTGHGRPITAGIAVPSKAAPGSKLAGGNFRLTDVGIPLDPASTGWDPATATANLPFRATVAPTPPVPLADPWVVGGGVAALLLLAGGWSLGRASGRW